MNDGLITFLSLSVAGAILVLILLLLKPVYKNRLSHKWQYYVWLIVIARLLIPFAPETNLVSNLFSNISTEVIEPITNAYSHADGDFFLGDGAGTNQPVLAENPFYDPSPANRKAGATEIIGAIWFVVALILLIRKITIYQSFVKYVRAGCTGVTDIEKLEQLGKIIDSQNIKTNVELCCNSLVSSPLLIGFWKPCIVLPAADISMSDFRFTILHELTHYKRTDLLYKWLTQAVICLHWFNPFVYVIGKEINRECELSCDEAVISSLSPKERRGYGDTLLNAIKAGGNYKNSTTSVTLWESKKILSERLGAIMAYKKQSKVIVLVSAALAGLFLCGATYVGAYSSSPSSNAEVTNEEKSKTPLGTKEDYQSLLALKTADYKNLTVVEFNNNLVEWSTQNMDGAYTAVIENDIAVRQFPEYLDAEERSFLSLTVKASNNENSVQMRSNYGKPPIDPDLSFELSRENMELDPPVWTQLMYGFSYQFDANKLTVGERDLALTKVINEVQNFWNSTDIKVLADMSSDDMLEQLKTIVETCSTETVKMSVVENYFMFQTSEMLE